MVGPALPVAWVGDPIPVTAIIGALLDDITRQRLVLDTPGVVVSYPTPDEQQEWQHQPHTTKTNQWSFGSAMTTTLRGRTSGCGWATLMIGTASKLGPSGPRPVARGHSVASG
eukprot:587142-Rhodomonas_salina.1